MSERIKDGGSAFPVQPCGADGLPESSCEFGMSLRDYFAAKAMQALIASTEPRNIGATYEQFTELTASAAFEYADAMLAAREVQR